MRRKRFAEKAPTVAHPYFGASLDARLFGWKRIDIRDRQN
jgi:hypothetical protein